jgi:hypothetical protein
MKKLHIKNIQLRTCTEKKTNYLRLAKNIKSFNQLNHRRGNDVLQK